ncbi:MAG: cob(I)yrinic acid a,c-diamide adenosyltransferase [Patescibacteria group bacterium]
MTERRYTPEQREQEKANRLEYAYTGSDTSYAVLGSLVRAIGKGWNILVIAPPDRQRIFQQLHTELEAPELLNVISIEQFETAQQSQKGKFDLVVSLYSNSDVNKTIRNSPSVLGKSYVMTVDANPDPKEYDLISGFTRNRIRESGVIGITGSGKGKTTTALGIAMESVLEGGRGAVIQWFKEKKSGALTWAINEHNFPDAMYNPNQLSFHPTGAGFVGSPNMDRVTEEVEHREKAVEGVELAKKLIATGEYTVIVLDEFVDTLKEVMSYLPYPLLELETVQELLALARESSTQVVVTGRQVTPEWEGFIQDSIVISEVKHPWSSKKAGAVSGLDF